MYLCDGFDWQTSYLNWSNLTFLAASGTVYCWKGQLLFDTFATNQVTHHLALTPYNDRNISVPKVGLFQILWGHLLPKSSISIYYLRILVNFGLAGYLASEGEKFFLIQVKILDFLKLGQRYLGTPVMILVDKRVVWIGLIWHLERSGTVY